jgi:hypothetical protein
MSDDPRQAYFTHIDVTSATGTERVPANSTQLDMLDVTALLRQLVAAQDRQNELLEELVQQMGAAQRQRAGELNQWKQANPALAQRCRQAAETLGRVQTQFLQNVTEEISDNADCLMDGEFMLNEFVDRFGPRLAHLNGVLQVLSQLSAGPVPTSNP